MMKTGIQISVIYTDEDFIELLVQASNGVFAGQVEVYAKSEALAVFAGMLRGFPTSPSDTREFEFGTFDLAYAGGGARFRFYCVDSVGHAVAEVRLQTDPRLGVDVSDVATLHVSVEAAAIDSLVGELERMVAEVGQAALLEAAV